MTGLDDLLTLPTMAGHAQASKLTLTSRLPRTPGVYLFRDRAGRVLYVGKATNLRSRVRSYFSGDTRRKVGQLLRETQAIDHRCCSTTLEAAVVEVRLIHEHLPRFNRQAKDWARYPYLKLTLNEAFPRLSVVRVAKDDGALYLGPLPSARAAKRVAEAIETAVPLRRCTATPRPLAPPGRLRAGPARRGLLPVRGRRQPRAVRRGGGPRACGGCSTTRSCCSSPSTGACTPWPPSSASRRPPTCGSGRRP